MSRRRYDGTMQRPLAAATKSLVLLCLPLLLSGCLTVSVWGGEVADKDNDGASSLSFSGGTPISDSVWVKLLVTPFALDVCTSPIQACWYGWNRKDDHNAFDCD